MSQCVKLLGLAVAPAEHLLLQDDVADRARAVYGPRHHGFSAMSRVFRTAGVERRHAVRPLDWYLEPRGWPERTAAYLDGARGMFGRAARDALGQARIAASEVDVVVTVSSTGVLTPSLDARVASDLGFRLDVMRAPIFGLGCAGGVAGLNVACGLARGRPGANVLMVAVETCTLAVRIDRMTKADVVATALFGDGAAACVLRAQDEGGFATVEGGSEHLWPGTLDVMGWTMDPEGFGVILDPGVPEVARSRLGPAVADMIERMGLSKSDVGRFVCHPGSAKVIAAVEQALDLGEGALDHERATLAEHGNMSSPTVLFILKRAIEAGLTGRAALVAMGPGFAASCVSLRMPG